MTADTNAELDLGLTIEPAASPSAPTPGEVYYADEFTTLYLGDSLDLIPTLVRDSIDAVVTDPPYGVAWQSNRRADTFPLIAGDEDDAVARAAMFLTLSGPLRNFRHVYVFGPTSITEGLPIGGATDLVWDKGALGMGDLSSPWAPQHERITFGVHVRSKANRNRGDGRLSARLRAGSVLRVDRDNSGAVKHHPTAKPVALIRQLIESSTLPGDVVLDPFAGTCATGVAATISGRRSVLIELEERYAKVGATRLAAAAKVRRQADAL